MAQRRAANDALAKKSELNQEDFLTLMITQLKHQDPFKPMDPSQYMGQLAQFSQVSGLADMNKQIVALVTGGDIPSNTIRGIALRHCAAALHSFCAESETSPAYRAAALRQTSLAEARRSCSMVEQTDVNSPV